MIAEENLEDIGTKYGQTHRQNLFDESSQICQKQGQCCKAHEEEIFNYSFRSPALDARCYGAAAASQMKYLEEELLGMMHVFDLTGIIAAPNCVLISEDLNIHPFCQIAYATNTWLLRTAYTDHELMGPALVCSTQCSHNS